MKNLNYVEEFNKTLKPYYLTFIVKKETNTLFKGVIYQDDGREVMPFELSKNYQISNYPEIVKWVNNMADMSIKLQNAGLVK